MYIVPKLFVALLEFVNDKNVFLPRFFGERHFMYVA